MSGPLPVATRDFLAADSLAATWQKLAEHLQRRRLQAEGTIRVVLNDDGADRLGQLLGTLVRPGPVRLDVARLDAALRTSAAACGVVAAVQQLTGLTLLDRSAAREASTEEWGKVWAELDQVFAERGLANSVWVPDLVSAVRRSGLLTRAGVTVASAAVQQLGGVLDSVPLPSPEDSPAGPNVVRWELAALASTVTGNAHGLDRTTVTAGLVLRVLAGAANLPAPQTSAQVREVWERAAVSTDAVSGTVLTWALRPPGTGMWAAMMRERADLGLVTHLTVVELQTATAPVEAGTSVWVCENPQVLQAAARAGVERVLVCTSGNPSSAGWMLLRSLLAAGAEVAYHGDFDWPGVAIAGRVLEAGAQPWRMGADDYRAAAAQAGNGGIELAGSPVRTPWDPDLACVMAATGVAVHEEACLDVLLGDLTSGP